jgi:hypothetical protein
MHVEMPVEQDVWPLSQTLVGVHATLAVQGEQEPLSQTALFPHVLPFAALLAPVATHVDVPVAHEVFPLSQLLVGVHETPAVQALQVPALQTMLLPHDVPLAALAIASTHTGCPVEQEIPPAWHGSAGLQGAPPVHATHWPEEQTRLVPQGVPSTALVTVSTHVEWPVEQDVAPVWHRFSGTQPRLDVQAMHAPALQTMLVPHVVPLPAGVFVSVHVATPPAHELTVPVWHASVGLQDAPTTHALQTPE